METQQVQMTAEELAEFEAFKASQAQKKAKQERQDALDTYKAMIDEQITLVMPELLSISEQLATVKTTVYENFKALIDMKRDTLKLTKEGQFSHTFTSSDGKARLILGYSVIDHYDDTANDGVELIKNWIQSKAKDDDTKALVDMVMKLLAKDNKGTLKASRVLQLRNMAAQINDTNFSEGVEIIMNAYKPIKSKQFIKAFVQGEDGEFEAIPLSITNAD